MHTSRREFMQRLGMGAVALAIRNAGAQSRPKLPNFVFFLVDDLGWTDVGYQGSTLYETPNVDRLASEGMRFNNSYAACPVCSPTRASIMTGKYPARLGITDWIPGQRPGGKQLTSPENVNNMPLSEVTIAESLKAAGYATCFVGKWHLGSEGFYPEDQGFDINIGGHEKGSPPGGYFAPYKNPRLEDGPEGEFLPERLTSESVKFLESQKENPFLLYFSFYSVHTPRQTKPEYEKKYADKLAAMPDPGRPEVIQERDGFTRQVQNNPVYAGMVQAMDEGVGRVLATLDRLGLVDNTIVIFMSDNGGLSTLFAADRSSTSNYPLRAGKGWCYEGGTREPMIIKWPGVTQAGAECDTPVISTDFYPTMLEMAGLPAKPEQHMDGVSLVPLLKGGSIDREAIYWHYPHYHGSAHRPSGAIRAGDYKLIEFYETDTVELYDLREDLSEKNDLAKAMPEKARQLRAMLHAWRRSVGAKMPKPNPDYTGE